MLPRHMFVYVYRHEHALKHTYFIYNFRVFNIFTRRTWTYKENSKSMSLIADHSQFRIMCFSIKETGPS